MLVEFFTGSLLRCTGCHRLCWETNVFEELDGGAESVAVLVHLTPVVQSVPLIDSEADLAVLERRVDLLKSDLVSIVAGAHG